MTSSQTLTYLGVRCKRGHEGLRYTKDGSCVPCRKARCQSETMKRWYWKNPEAARQKANKSYAENAPKRAPAKRTWQLKNKGKVNAACARRHAQKLNATPRWLTNEQLSMMEEVYATCPAGWHVDHIVPLQSPAVCGLHVPWNLQHLTKAENLSKGNKFEDKL